MSDLQGVVVEKFFEYYRGDLESQIIDERNVVISFPVHFSGFHRIEVTITSIGGGQYLISDGANTLSELKSAGYAIGSKLKKRIEELSRSAAVRIVNSHLVADTDINNLGSSIQRFLEAAKTIGDAYLVQRPVAPKNKNLIESVAAILSAGGLVYRPKEQVRGSIENHRIDFFFHRMACRVWPSPYLLIQAGRTLKHGRSRSPISREAIPV
jgi:hypothetical protein